MKKFVSTTALTLLAAIVSACPHQPIYAAAAADSNAAARPADRAGTSPFQPVSGRAGDTIFSDGVVYDFGTITLDPRHPIVHDFKLRNATDKPIAIERVQPACGCTTVTPDNGAPGNYRPIAPGQALNIHVSVDPKDLPAGNIDKAIWVYLPGNARPAAVLHVRGVTVSPVIFEPQQVNFGDVKAGTKCTAHIKMLLDPKVYGAETPDLIASSPGVTVKPEGGSASAAGKITRSYSITLSKDATLGPMRLNLYLPLENKTPFNSPGTFVSANIIGDISASPMEIAFGTIADGQEGEQNIVLKGVTQEALKGIRVSTDDPNLHGEVTAIEAGGAAEGAALKSTAILCITLNSKTKGSYQSRIKLTTKSGQVLELPVWAWIN